MSKTNIINGIMSYYGWTKHGDCKQLFDKYIDTNIQNIMENNCFSLKQKNPLKEILI